MSDDTKPSVTPSPSPLPEEPMPIPPVPEATPSPAPSNTPPAPPPPEPNPEKVMESILDTHSQDSMVVPPPTSDNHHNASLPKKPGKGMLIALVALLLFVLPVSVYFISQQNQQLSDVRSRASGNSYDCPTGPGFECCVDDPNTCPGQGGPNACHCQGGQPCLSTACEDLETNCHNDGRDWCVNSGGYGMTCCARGYSCGPNDEGCYPNGGDDNGDDDNGDDTVENTPTPTPGNTPVCQNIKLYKDGTQVTDLTTLRPGDVVVLAVKGNLSPTKAHFRINGGTWTETTTTNSSGEFTLSYTIPDGITDFVIEGEVFTNGAWR